MDDDWVQRKRMRLTQQALADQAEALNTSNFQRDTFKIRSDISNNVEKMLVKEHLGEPESARLEAQLAEHERKKAKAAEMRNLKLKEAAKAGLEELLGTEGLDTLVARLEKESRRARGRVALRAERRIPRKMSAEEKAANRRGAKRNKSREMGLIIGERRSWTKEKEELKSDGIERITIDQFQNLNEDVKATKTLFIIDEQYKQRYEMMAEERRQAAKRPQQSLPRISREQSGAREADYKKELESRREASRLDPQAIARRMESLEQKVKNQEDLAVSVRAAETTQLNRAATQLLHAKAARSKGCQCFLEKSEEVTLAEEQSKAENENTSEKAAEATKPGTPHSQIFQIFLNIYTHVTKRVQCIILGTISCYSLLWFSVYCSLSRHCSLMPRIAMVAVCVLKDLWGLYFNQHKFWLSEEPQLLALTMTSWRMVGYVAWVVLTLCCGPIPAATVVCLLPQIDREISCILRRCWGYRCPGPREIQGPFPEKANNPGSARLMSFDINMNHAYLLKFWNMMIQGLGYASSYIVLFSQDSWFSKSLALVVAICIRSRCCPQLQAVKDGELVDRLARRELRFTMGVDCKDYPSFREYFDQSAKVVHRVYQNSRPSIRRLRGLTRFADGDVRRRTTFKIQLITTFVVASWLIISLCGRQFSWMTIMNEVALGAQWVSHRVPFEE